jgi:glycosyltransferase involved in cell wall biosynthesis
MKKPYIATIVIPTYNNCELLNYTLKSITQQSINTNIFEVIIVDDGSSDTTADMIEAYRSVLYFKYFYQEDRGNRVSLARNVGIQNAEADIIILIDSGILVDNFFIAEHVMQHNLHGNDCAVIGYVCGFDQYGENLQEIALLTDKDNPSRAIKKFRSNSMFKDMRDPYYKKYNSDINGLPAPWAFFLTCNVSVNRSYLDRVGLFDEIFDQRWGVEDLDMGYRLYANNIKFVIAEKAIALHYPHDSSMEEKFEEEIYNKYLFHKKHNSLATQTFLESTFIDLNDKLLLAHKPYKIRL